MSLRNQVPDAEATYEDPVLGVNLGVSPEDLQRGECAKMQNLVYKGGLVTREGSTLHTTISSGGLDPIRGGHMFYYGSNKDRLTATGQSIDKVEDNGSYVAIWTDMTDDKETYFTTWPITEKVYITNGVDPMFEWDGTNFVVVGAVNIRTSAYSWTLSTGGGTSTYYLRTSGGGDPNVSTTGPVMLDGVVVPGSVATALTPGQYAFDDVDTLGYNTVYVRLADNADPDSKVDGFVQKLSSVTLPGLTGWINGQSQTIPAAKAIIGLSDRLFALTPDGIERCDPRDPTVWSWDSTWATLRPSQSGTFLAHIPHSVSSQTGEPINGALAFTDSDYYFYTGTDFGDDVTNATASNDEDSSIKHIANIGIAGTKCLEHVPGVGTFFITNQKNVYFIPAGSVYGQVIGDRIYNTGGGSVDGIESMLLYNTSGEPYPSWVVYWEPYLMVGFCVDNPYPDTQYWLDLTKFNRDRSIPVWYGPMKGQSPSVVWKENQRGDLQLMGGDGDLASGLYLYTLRVKDTYTDARAAATNNIACEYTTYLKSGGAPSREKYVQQVEVEMNEISGSATCDIADLSGTILSDLPVEKTFT